LINFIKKTTFREGVFPEPHLVWIMEAKNRPAIFKDNDLQEKILFQAAINRKLFFG
jgi:hypothetical protein